MPAVDVSKLPPELRDRFIKAAHEYAPPDLVFPRHIVFRDETSEGAIYFFPWRYRAKRWFLDFWRHTVLGRTRVVHVTRIRQETIISHYDHEGRETYEDTQR